MLFYADPQATILTGENGGKVNVRTCCLGYWWPNRKDDLVSAPTYSYELGILPAGMPIASSDTAACAQLYGTVS